MRILLFLFPFLLLPACSSTISVSSDLDNTVDFTTYKTLEYWGWKENSDQIMNRFDKERIENAFGEEFERRGMSVVEKGSGDMIVTLYIVTEKKVSTTANTTYAGGAGGYYGYGPGYGWSGGHSTTTYSNYEYTVGTLMVSAYDSDKKVLIWEAIGKGVIDEKPKDPEADIKKAVSAIMAEYPTKPVE